MANDTGPLGGSGPVTRPNLGLAAIRARFENIERRLSLRERNRTPEPLPLHLAASNAGPVSQAQHGHGVVYSEPQGMFVPSPVLAELPFHMPGPLSLATSPPLHARYACSITGIAADLGVFSTDVEFEVLVNGTMVYTINQTSQSTGLIPVAPTALVAYTDLITVQTTSIGTGNSDLVVHVELGVVVGTTPGP